MGGSASISLDAKYRPSTEAAKATFDAILSVTGDLLGEVGFERLSTNMVAARAGLTPPALYRYFPNKYALLAELGRRLMAAQDDEVIAWQADLWASERPALEDRIAASVAIMKRTVEIAREMPGGAWIMRALRAVPLLQQVRVESRDLVADSLFAKIRRWFPETPEADLRLACRLSIELSYSAIEMVVEEVDIDADGALRATASMIEGHFERLG